VSVVFHGETVTRALLWAALPVVMLFYLFSRPRWALARRIISNQ